jgi:hypothetical protein
VVWKLDRLSRQDLKRVTGKNNLLFQLAQAALQHPEGIVKDVVYPIVPEQTLRDLIKEWRASGPAYQQKVTLTMRDSYRSHYRRMLPRRLGSERQIANEAAERRAEADTRIRGYADTISFHACLSPFLPIIDIDNDGDE